MSGDELAHLQRPRRPAPELAASPRVARAPVVRSMPSEAPSMDTVLSRMAPGLRLVGMGVVLMIADIGYAAYSGAAFSLGPVRAFWIAAPLVGWGIVRLALSLIS
jgi:hypothetical protein